MSDDNPYVIPEMDPTLRTQIQECNWQVVNATTPANYFHVLRRQVSATNWNDLLSSFDFDFVFVCLFFFFFIKISYDFLFHYPDTQGIP